MESTILQINSFEAFFGIGSILITIGIAWGKLQVSLKQVQKTLETEIKPELKELRTNLIDLRERYIVAEERVDILWKNRLGIAHSPRQLNAQGNKILENSGIKEIIDNKKDYLLALVKQENPATPYDAEKITEKIVMKLLTYFPSLETELKNGAFGVGADISEVLYVGSLYLRDEIFPDLGFNLEEWQK